MDHHITEANGQVITVHRGWTTRREKVLDHKRHPKQPTKGVKQYANSSASILVWSSIGEKAPSPSPIGSPRPEAPSQSVEVPQQQPAVSAATPPQRFEFVHSAEPFRHRDPDVRKLVRTYAMKDSAHRRKQMQQRQQKEELEIEERNGKMKVGLEFLKRGKHDIKFPDSMCDMSDSNSFLSNSLTLLSIEPDPYLTGVVHDLATVSTRMYPRESLFKFNPVSPANWFHFALADPAFFHALMYAMAAYSSLFEGALKSTRATTEFNRCVSLVSRTLAGPRKDIADGTIAAVACLALVEAVAGNETGWNMHMNGAKQMVETRGCFSELSETIRMKLLRADITGAVDFVAKTHFPFQRSRRPSIYETLSFPELDVAGDRLNTLLISYDLETRLVEVFASLSRFSRALDFALSHNSILMKSLAFVEDTFEIQFGLLSIPEPSLYETDDVCIQEAMRIGALIYVKELLQEYPLGPSGSIILVRRLIHALSFISDIKKYAPVILWLLFVGAVSAKKALDREWFIVHLTRLMPKHSTWQDVKNILKKVLWVEKLFDHPSRGLWNEIEMARALNL